MLEVILMILIGAGSFNAGQIKQQSVDAVIINDKIVEIDDLKNKIKSDKIMSLQAISEIDQVANANFSKLHDNKYVKEVLNTWRKTIQEN